MCGRYASDLPPDAIARLFGTVNPLPNAAATWNLAPSQEGLVVRRRPDTGERHLDPLRWGLIPHFTKDPKGGRRPINARAETVASSGMFKGAIGARGHQNMECQTDLISASTEPVYDTAQATIIKMRSGA